MTEKSTEALILDTARKHFTRFGYSGARMQTIANEAGINKALLHYYFRSKEKLYLETVRQTISSLIPKLALVMSGAEPFWIKIEQIVETYIRELIEQPDIAPFIISEISQRQSLFLSEIKNTTNRFPEIPSFIEEIQLEMEKGNIRKSNPLQVFLNLISMIVFPFVARPMITTIFNVSEENFELLVTERKEHICTFLKHALNPEA